MLNLKNEFIMAPIKLGYADGSGQVNHKHISFYAERSHHIGAVTVEPFYIDKGLRELPTQLGIDADDKIPGLQRLTEIIHACGAKAIAHLNHPGRMANPKIPENYYLSSTDKACENGGAVPKRMNKEDMKTATNLFISAAIRAKQTGFDIIELQLGHGYLLAQFISPAVNDRKDDFGGSFQNRIRFPLEVLKAVRRAVDLPIITRISGDEMIPNGIKLEDMITFCKILEEQDVNAIHVSAGTVCSTPPWFFQHMFVEKGKTWELAAKIKKEIGIPVIFVGRINSRRDVDKLKNELRADYIALGRAMVADPHFVGKYEGKIIGAIRPCLACSEGCLGGVRAGRGLHCVVNPMVGTGFEAPIPAEEPKKYAVIGGGLAGLQAALTLKERGHSADLFEKDRLGGQFNLAYLPPHKESFKELIDYFENEIKEKDIKVINKTASEEDLIGSDYDGVIIATGAVPDIPQIKGLKEYYWAEFLLEENLPADKKVIVIGGGLIGIEIASKLVDKNNEVVIVEMLDDVARNMEMIEKTLTLKKLKMKKVSIYTRCRVTEIKGDKVLLSGEKETIIDGVDRIVVATGMKSNDQLSEPLRSILPVCVIGDAREVGKADHAIRDGFLTACKL
jgi:2,4-dienoyl-CoA reductase (NADPH2)